MKILSVVGTRPNFVKVAPLLAEMGKHPEIETFLIHTGQHYDPEMSGCFFRELGLPRPNLNLGVGFSSVANPIQEIVRRLEPVLREERPDLVLVVGDVNSTVAGAVAAARKGIPVAHVEAGLRSFDPTMPEEANRVATDAVSKLLFATEPSAVENLLREGRQCDEIFLVGNLMIDALRRFLPSARRSNTLVNLGLQRSHGAYRRERYAILTLHRPALLEGSEDLPRIWAALVEISRRIPIVFPMHPRTRNRLRDLLGEGHLGRSEEIRMIPPLSYLQFLHLESEATLVITDSGGIQEETTALNIPCLTVRENTERPITVTEGTNTVVGLDPDRLEQEAAKILSGRVKQGRTPKLWDGHCAERIARILCGYFTRDPLEHQDTFSDFGSAFTFPSLTA